MGCPPSRQESESLDVVACVYFAEHSVYDSQKWNRVGVEAWWYEAGETPQTRAPAIISNGDNAGSLNSAVYRVQPEKSVSRNFSYAAVAWHFRAAFTDVFTSGRFKGGIGGGHPLLAHIFVKKPLFPCKRHIFRCAHLR